MGLGRDYYLTKKPSQIAKASTIIKIFIKYYIFLRTVCSAFTKRASAPIAPT